MQVFYTLNSRYIYNQLLLRYLVSTLTIHVENMVTIGVEKWFNHFARPTYKFSEKSYQSMGRLGEGGGDWKCQKGFDQVLRLINLTISHLQSSWHPLQHSTFNFNDWKMTFLFDLDCAFESSWEHYGMNNLESLINIVVISFTMYIKWAEFRNLLSECAKSVMFLMFLCFFFHDLGA